MKKFGWKSRFSALALSAALIGGASSAVADDVDETNVKLGDVSNEKFVNESAAIVSVGKGTVVTRQTIDGVEVSFEWSVPDEWIAPEGDGVAYGVFGTLIKLGLSIWDEMMDGDKGGSGGGGGGGNTNTCNVNVTGAQVVVIGNLNCGGTQSGTGGTGTGTGGGGRPQ